jgi:hypothetical protein
VALRYRRLLLPDMKRLAPPATVKCGLLESLDRYRLWRSSWEAARYAAPNSAAQSASFVASVLPSAIFARVKTGEASSLRHASCTVNPLVEFKYRSILLPDMKSDAPPATVKLGLADKID